MWTAGYHASAGHDYDDDDDDEPGAGYRPPNGMAGDDDDDDSDDDPPPPPPDGFGGIFETQGTPAFPPPRPKKQVQSVFASDEPDVSDGAGARSSYDTGFQPAAMKRQGTARDFAEARLAASRRGSDQVEEYDEDDSSGGEEDGAGDDDGDDDDGGSHQPDRDERGGADARADGGARRSRR